MRKIREILRLKWSLGRTNREIGQSVKVSTSTVSDCLKRASKAELSWPLAPELDDAALNQLLYSPCTRQKIPVVDRNIDWAEVHAQKQRKGVTLNLLWLEYKANHPDGFRYSRYCELYRKWLKTVDVCMRQTYKGGEKMFVDYAGLTMPLVNPETGEVREVSLLVKICGSLAAQLAYQVDDIERLLCKKTHENRMLFS